MGIKILIICVLLCGCYSQKKARQDIAKADISYPEELAKYCADKYPVVIQFTPGDTILMTDTFTVLETNILIDTLTVNDTVRITKTLPGKTTTVTNTIHIVDTVYQENSAALKACEIIRDDAVQLAAEKTKDVSMYKKRTATRLYIIIGLLLAAGVWTYFKFKGSLIKTKIL